MQDFIDLLYIPMRRKIGGSAFEAAKLRVAGRIIDLVGEVRGLLHLQSSQQLLEMRRQVVTATAASYEVAKRLRAAGNNTELDLANEQALFEQSRLDLRAAEAQVVQDRERLNRLMGLWGPDAASWKVLDRLQDVPQDATIGEGSEPHCRRTEPRPRRRPKDVEAAGRSLGLAGPAGLLPDVEVGRECRTRGGRRLGGRPGLLAPDPALQPGPACQCVRPRRVATRGRSIIARRAGPFADPRARRNHCGP